MTHPKPSTLEELAEEFADSNQCEVMDTLSAHADSFKAGYIKALQSAEVKAMKKVLKQVQREERDRVFEDAGCPGFDGPMSIGTKYDDCIEAFDVLLAEVEK